LILIANGVHADDQAGKLFQFTGAVLIDGVLIYPLEGDAGYLATSENHLYTSNEESVRLVVSGRIDPALSWEIQYLNQRNSTDLPATAITGNPELFRIKNTRHYFVEDGEGEHKTYWYHELDRLNTKYEYKNYSVVAGRQAVSWGSGRFWQPTDVFGAFSPTELNRDYKPGIDALKFDWYPTPNSSHTLAYVFGNQDIDDLEDSGAWHYRTIIGQSSEITLLAGKIAGVVTGGGSFETSWLGMGWRMESIIFKIPDNDSNDNFTIAGVDYQFDNGLFIGVEHYHNSLGVPEESDLAQSARQVSYINGQQKHLSRNVTGIALSKPLTPLLTGSYNFLASSLVSPDNETSWSTLHQFSFLYSLMDEADALLAILYGTGKGLDSASLPRSEFGHIPLSISLRLRAFF